VFTITDDKQLNIEGSREFELGFGREELAYLLGEWGSY
jgi:hypothetical protein